MARQRMPFLLGRFGEDVVARVFGYKRLPASGARWPYKEDLVKEAPLKSYLAQVKTTTNKYVLQTWRDLERHANTEGKIPKLFEVIVTPEEVLVFEKVLVRKLTRGIGGEVSG